MLLRYVNSHKVLPPKNGQNHIMKKSMLMRFCCAPAFLGGLGRLGFSGCGAVVGVAVVSYWVAWVQAGRVGGYV